MIPEALRKALADFREGRLTEKDILDLLKDLPYENLDFARVDHHRGLRHGFPEVIFGIGKTPEQIEAIGQAVLAKNPNLLVTRAGAEAFERLKAKFPESEFHPNCGAVTVLRQPLDRGRGKIGIFSAGTADIPIADEAAVTARVMGNQTHCCYDIGVAGLHRLLSQLEILRACTVLIVVAGMEGALPSVVGGLVDLPVIAVPTSIGYGASFNGIAALLGMLNSCSANVSVVNIDNGFGAGYIASLINRKPAEEL